MSEDIDIKRLKYLRYSKKERIIIDLCNNLRKLEFVYNNKTLGEYGTNKIFYYIDDKVYLELRDDTLLISNKYIHYLKENHDFSSLDFEEKYLNIIKKYLNLNDVVSLKTYPEILFKHKLKKSNITL